MNNFLLAYIKKPMLFTNVRKGGYMFSVIKKAVTIK